MADWAKFWNPLLDKIWNNLELGICLVGEDNKFLKVNPLMCRMLGYTETELLELEWQAVTVPSDVKDDIREVRNVLAGVRTSYSMLKFYQPKIGPPFPARLTVVAMHDGDKNFAYFVSQVIPLSAATPTLSEQDQATLLVAKWLERNWKKVLYIVLIISALLAGAKVGSLIELLRGI